MNMNMLKYVHTSVWWDDVLNKWCVGNSCFRRKGQAEKRARENWRLANNIRQF